MSPLVGVLAAAMVLALAWRAQPTIAGHPARRGRREIGHSRRRRRRRRWRRHWQRAGPWIAVCVATLVGGPLIGAAFIVTTSVVKRLRVLRSRRRMAACVAATFPDFVDLFVLSIKAGLTPVQALASLESCVDEPLRSALVSVVHRIDVGERFAEAIGGLTTMLGPIAAPLVDALALADRYGNPLPPILDRLADDARNQRRRNAEASARRLPVLLCFPLVVCTLPSFVLLTIVPLLVGTLSSLRGLAA